ncbi:mechanosensitive ion channel family protein [Bdellovibrio bacteriovorus]|uniref:Putative efflux protein n=1 Tax=Bdellovibrio bacteriovorus str. Tiberius TaxID=1069642 RepID=K7YRG4_BDEBC|nr:mechanosensitive ion channel domain-containing protein [Bdellovibrio bacteriovorus]AFY02431.1 putative efflux protein [Bdellovibrio bacteriovorus str. Tiberius]
MEDTELYQQLKQVWQMLNEPIFRIKDAEISAASVLVSILLLIVAIYGSKLVSKIVVKQLSRRRVDSGVRDSIAKFVRYALVVMGVLFALDNMGISISSLAAVGAVLMVGIGFGLQNVTQNFIAGIILLIERPIKVGDIIQVGETSGKVIDIRVRSSIIQTRDEVTIIVPNSKFIAEEVTNESLASGKIRQHVKVGVAYGSDVALVKQVLIEAALQHPEVVQDPKPNALLKDFGESALIFDLRFWCRNIWRIETITSDIRTTIDARFRENKIMVPYPRMDVSLVNQEITRPNEKRGRDLDQ